ncbi:hypothetical protein Q4F19_20630 [Sphingomonas sp. BIUV-7]|uniref:Uncharacterized protein n=1 Tax=Sphingomonas natans TaxID=3063330 RepID=A0ABT8YEQ5_9SPHN|nr:hypothetical protein [Sphingomonas sp. BIUV-7]
MTTALAASALAANGVQAQSITAGGSIDGRIGYGSNPYLQLNSPGGTGIGGGTLTGWLQSRSETSQTRLTGIADLSQNFRYYGLAENYQATLDHRQTISNRLSASGRLRYQDSINARNFDNSGLAGESGTIVDLLSIGQRTRTYGADGTLQWTPTSRDSFYIGPQYSHTTYPSTAISDFEQYGLSAGYLRQVNARMKLGVDTSLQRVKSDAFASSTSYNAALRLVYDFNEIWQFDGNVGIIFQKSGIGGTTSTPGFSAQLCGKYPRYRVCVQGSRQSAASGFGGLRTDNRIGANVTYDLSARSSVNFAAVYDVSESRGLSIIPKQKYWELSGGYSRTLTDRLSAGFSGRYQHRDYGSLVAGGDSTVSGYAATLDIAYKFGRLE